MMDLLAVQLEIMHAITHPSNHQLCHKLRAWANHPCEESDLFPKINGRMMKASKPFSHKPRL